MIEAEVHSYLRDFLRAKGEASWIHHLTMARLVARALRLGRCALIQTVTTKECYSLSYLTPALIWQGAVILVCSPTHQVKLIQELIPTLQTWLGTNKKIVQENDLPLDDDFQGLLLLSPDTWLTSQLQDKNLFPPHIPTLIDQAEDLETWTRSKLTTSIGLEDWQLMMADHPQLVEEIRNVRVKLTKAIFDHPPNPHECYVLDASEQQILRQLFTALHTDISSGKNNLWQQWYSEEQLMWASVVRAKGHFTLHCAPVQVSENLAQIWQRQPVVFMGSFLDQDTQASIYCQQLGIQEEEVTCVKFSPNRQTGHLQLYMPDYFPLPNTPQFSSALLHELSNLLNNRGGNHPQDSNVGNSFNYESFYQRQKPVVIIIEDVPLKAQVGANLAAEFGSLVQVEKEKITPGGILVTGWEFWQQHQDSFPTPQLLVITTLPLPSLEHPLVAGRVNYYKSKRQDWFRLYLLPTALQQLQKVVIPLRESQGVLALLDSRVNYRSYGKQILSVLEPYAKINYWLGNGEW